MPWLRRALITARGGWALTCWSGEAAGMDTGDRREEQQLDGPERAAQACPERPDSDDDEITAMVRSWPPLTESQRERLALLLL
ncbi:MAG TPA: hypothetical protein VFV66_10665 [Nonomuraea sp.]|nr:hypothetical protein [Nonomuraea sp.]